ncbi:MAG: YraN family protein [Reinekea sp.]
MTKNKLRHLIKGKTAESQAEIFLTKQGIKPITRNFSSRFGEIDLIGMDKKTLDTKYNKHPMRFDVIGINASDEIEWIKGAFLSAV